MRYLENIMSIEERPVSLTQDICRLYQYGDIISGERGVRSYTLGY
jgi:hypothetical protein